MHYTRFMRCGCEVLNYSYGTVQIYIYRRLQYRYLSRKKRTDRIFKAILTSLKNMENEIRFLPFPFLFGRLIKLRKLPANFYINNKQFFMNYMNFLCISRKEKICISTYPCDVHLTDQTLVGFDVLQLPRQVDSTSLATCVRFDDESS